MFGAVSYGLSEIFINLVSSGEPLLRDLTIICTQELRKSGRATRYGSLYSPILSKDIPTLCTLYLYSFPLTPQLSGLRHLTNVDLIDPGSTATNAILELLANNPCLQWVNIQGPLHDQGSTREDRSVALPQLRHFLTYECEATEILRCLHLPRLGLFEIDMQYSFNRVPLPGAYQPYSVLQLARDFQFHDINLITSPEVCLKISNGSEEAIIAEFGELPPNSVEVLGLSTVQLIKRLCFRERLNEHFPASLNTFHHMERLDTLALDCASPSLGGFLSVLRRGAIFPSLCTLITRLRSNIPAHDCHNALLEVVRNRASVGNAIQRLRVIVPSEEHVVLYSDNFYLFVEQFETQVSTRGELDPPQWLVWKD